MLRNSLFPGGGASGAEKVDINKIRRMLRKVCSSRHREGERGDAPEPVLEDRQGRQDLPR